MEGDGTLEGGSDLSCKCGYHQLLSSHDDDFWPGSLLSSLEQAIRNFVWSGDITKKAPSPPCMVSLLRTKGRSGSGNSIDLYGHRILSGSSFLAPMAP